MPHPKPSQRIFRSTQFPRKSAASIPGDGTLRLIVPAPQQTIRPNGDALEFIPTLRLSLAFDERTLPAETAAQALTDTCARLENLLSLLI